MNHIEIVDKEVCNLLYCYCMNSSDNWKAYCLCRSGVDESLERDSWFQHWFSFSKELAMSNNSPTLQQHTTDTSNTNDTNRHDQQRQRMPPIVVSNVSGSRSSSSSPLASSADPPQTVNKQAPTPPSTTSLSTLGQYLPISTSLPEGMQQVLPLHSPLWTDLLPLLALQQSVAPSPSQSARRHTASAPVTTSQPQEHAAQPESSSTTLNRQQSAKDISRQSATHKCISVTQAKGSNSNKGTFIRIPVRAIVKNASNHDDDHRTATTNQSISATQASNNASTKKTSSKKKGATKKGIHVLERIRAIPIY